MSCSITYDEVHYTYPDGTEALGGVSFALAHGEHVALLGPNGAGKSTIMLLSNGVLLPSSGTITVGEVQLAKDTLVPIRRRVGLVFQDPDDQLFMTTVHDDVAFGPLNAGLASEEVEQRVSEALNAVGLAGSAASPASTTGPAAVVEPSAPAAVVEPSVPAAVASLAYKAPHDLSFGQKKRAALATILALRPDFLILDEPTSNLDPRGRRQMMELIRSIEGTVLIATHDLDLVWELTPRSIILDKGSIVADGPTHELLANEALLEAHGLELPAAVRYGTR